MFPWLPENENSSPNWCILITFNIISLIYIPVTTINYNDNSNLLIDESMTDTVLDICINDLHCQVGFFF